MGSTPNQNGNGTERPRRVRTSKPKVKTGCNNCKQRRIKCDENRPACSQCVRSKKDCTGYPPPPRPKIFEEVRIAPRPAEGSAPGRPEPAAVPHMLVAQVRRRPPVVAPSPPRKLTPPLTPVEASLTLYQPATFALDAHEGQYFQLFREHTASELSGFFDSSFWTRSVLQQCHSEEAVRHSVVALGALYKTLDKMTESPPGSPSDMVDVTDHVHKHWEVAFKHYHYAIKAMSSAMSQDHSTQRTSLTATVLLACFDSFIGDHKQAILQIQSGLGLLEQLRAERRRAFLPKPEEPVDQDLIQMFTRLAIQAKSYDMAFHFPQPFVIRLTPQHNENPASPQSDAGSPVSTTQPHIPEKFQSLIEARLAWDCLCERIMRFNETMFSYTRTISPMGILPQSLQSHGDGFRDQMKRWSIAFEPILASRTAPSKSSQEKTGIAVLKMNQIMGLILFMMTFADDEMQFDRFLPEFRRIVELAMEVVGDEERRAAAKRCPDPRSCHHHTLQPDIFGGDDYNARHIKPSFSADLGVVPPLFVVATKCRDPVIRRQAIQLLRTSSRREGMWDSELAARIGMWITTIEEEEEDTDEPPRPISSSNNSYSMGSPASAKSSAMYSIESPGAYSNGSAGFGDDVPPGPGGNARWGGSRGENGAVLPPVRPEKKTIPAEKRVMVRAVEFDLRDRVATLQCGTRGLIPGMPDLRTRVTRISWGDQA
ncbi:hypothetical protein DL770_002388 [Monosporascus sp. CRB-9-2]|nr:hypothetical protein DL770_002388 [Monosporascus sp. CRB-9-2]